MQNGQRIRPMQDGYSYIGASFNVNTVNLTAAKITGIGLTAYDYEVQHSCTLKSIKCSVYFSLAAVYMLRIYKGSVTDGDTTYDALAQVGSDIFFNGVSNVAANTFYVQNVTINASITAGDKLFSAWSVDPDPGSPMLFPQIIYNLTA